MGLSVANTADVHRAAQVVNGLLRTKLNFASMVCPEVEQTTGARLNTLAYAVPRRLRN